jgi:phosphoglucosamine mutase
VLAELKQHAGILGGEASGHLLCLDRATTGDGLVAALQVLAVMKKTGNKLSELASGVRLYPQVLLNVRTAQRIDPNANAAIRSAREEVECELGRRGRVVLRASGTEPVIRVMVEGEDEHEIGACANRIAECVRASVS